MLRIAEVLQLKLENKGLFAMLQEIKNLQTEPDQEEKVALKKQMKLLEDKNTSLQEDNNKVQEDKKAMVDKTKELEDMIQLIEHNNKNEHQTLEQLRNDVARKEKETGDLQEKIRQLARK